MKKILVGFSIIMAAVSCSAPPGKYRIEDASGKVYYADRITHDLNGCIRFNNTRCKCPDEGPGTPTILCGSYTITEQKTTQP